MKKYLFLIFGILLGVSLVGYALAAIYNPSGGGGGFADGQVITVGNPLTVGGTATSTITGDSTASTIGGDLTVKGGVGLEVDPVNGGGLWVGNGSQIGFESALGAADGVNISSNYSTSSLTIFTPNLTAEILDLSALTGYRTATLPDKNGTIAMTSDIPANSTNIKSQYFLIENPTSTEDDAFFIFPQASTITKVWAVNKTTGDTATINLAYDSSRATASSSAHKLFASDWTVTATTTPTSTTTFASSTPAKGDVLRLFTPIASTTQLLIQIDYYIN